MQVVRKFIISCERFGGYTVRLTVNDFENIKQVVSAVIDKLKETLKSHCFESLLDILKQITENYHMHDVTIEQILLVDKPYYICNHGCQIQNTESNASDSAGSASSASASHASVSHNVSENTNNPSTIIQNIGVLDDNDDDETIPLL